MTKPKRKDEGRNGSENDENNKSIGLEKDELKMKRREAKLQQKEKKAKFKEEEEKALRLHAEGRHDEVDSKILAIALRKRQKRSEQRSVRRKKDQKDMKEVRKIIKKELKEAKIRRRERLAEKRKKKKKKPTRKQILFSAPEEGSADDDDDVDEDTSKESLQQPKAWLHDLLDFPLPSKQAILNDMTDAQRHNHLTWLAEQGQRITNVLLSLVGIDGERNSVEDAPTVTQSVLSEGYQQEFLADMVRLRHVPLARRYTEMSLWKRVQQFLHRSLSVVEDLEYGASDAVDSENKQSSSAVQQEGGQDGSILMHDESSKDPKFCSFRDKYISKLLVQHEKDLESMRINERMNEDQVRFLRGCLETSASLYANIKCWDEDQREKKTSSNAAKPSRFQNE